MSTWAPLVLTAFVSVLASSGFWAYMQRRSDKKDAKTMLLMGSAYEHIMTYGIGYINRGWITKDEYEELTKYFYKPYKELGGNGVAERVMNEVSKLPFSQHDEYASIFRNREQERYINNVRVVANPRQQAAAE